MKTLGIGLLIVLGVTSASIALAYFAGIMLGIFLALTNPSADPEGWGAILGALIGFGLHAYAYGWLYQRAQP